MKINPSLINLFNVFIKLGLACHCNDNQSTHFSQIRKFVLRSKQHNTLLGVNINEKTSNFISAYKFDESLLEEHNTYITNVFFSTCDPRIDFKKVQIPFTICLGGHLNKELCYNTNIEKSTFDIQKHQNLLRTEAVLMGREDDRHMFTEISIKLRTFLGPHIPVLIVNRHRPGRYKAGIELADSHKNKIVEMNKAHLLITDIR
nr:uncharacterized protein LOC121126838 isoform X2 [Lepeophtheirus salmonis]